MPAFARSFTHPPSEPVCGHDAPPSARITARARSVTVALRRRERQPPIRRSSRAKSRQLVPRPKTHALLAQPLDPAAQQRRGLLGHREKRGRSCRRTSRCPDPSPRRARSSGEKSASKLLPALRRIAITRGKILHRLGVGQVQAAASRDEEFAADRGLVIGEHRAQSRRGDDLRRAQSGRAAAHDQHIVLLGTHIACYRPVILIASASPDSSARTTYAPTSRRRNYQPAGQRIWDSFQKEMIPYLLSILPDELFSPGREPELFVALNKALYDKYVADGAHIPRDIQFRLQLDICSLMPAFKKLKNMDELLQMVFDPGKPAPTQPPPDRSCTSVSGKILTLDEVAAFRAELRKQRRKVVATNGCFDLLHVGHCAT